MKLPREQQGFVLIATMIVLFIVALAAGYFAERVSRSALYAEQSQRNTQAMIDMASTRAELQYRLTTTSLTVYGLGRDSALVHLDNRPYRSSGDTIVQLQDNAGLLNLNAVSDERLHRLLGMMAVPVGQRARLIDTLRDYIDVDDLHRLNGAEKADYLAVNLPPPPNRILVSPWEAKGIIGWRSTPQLWEDDRLVQLTTTSGALALNPNTAPVENLATLPGMTDELAQRIVTRRNLAPIFSVQQLGEITGLPTKLMEDVIGVLPIDSIRVTQSTPGLAWAVIYNITLTPKAKDAPWQIDYYHRAGAKKVSENAPQAPPLPPRSMAPPESQPL